MSIWALLVIYQFKHFVADYPLQGRYMLGKFKSGREWILPLAAHATVHFAFTFAICLAVRPTFALPLALLDFCVHFVVDRVKASPHLLGRFKPTQPYFWWALGADQMAHHLTHYLIIWRLYA
jgi:hypothetical protein